MAKARTSAAVSTVPSDPATRGAPTRMAISRAETLLPSTRIAAGVGPIQSSPASITA